MRVTLVKNKAKATIIPERGGLLASLVLPFGSDAVETLFMPADFAEEESGWPGGGAPLMFPFAGRTFHEDRPFFYELEGNVYNMPLHGFSWAKPWTVKDASETSVLITQEDGPGTRELFPFAWRQEACYELADDHLQLTWTMTNLGSTTSKDAAMPVAAGIHPYFRLLSEKAELICDATEVMQVTPAGAAGKPSAHVQTSPQLSEPLYRNLIMRGMKTPRAGLTDKEKDYQVTIGWNEESPIQHVVLWRKEDQPFHCIEPWMGLPDAVSNGSGLKRLATGESLKITFTIKGCNRKVP